MITNQSKVQVLSDLIIDLTIEEIAEKIQTSAGSQAILDIAEQYLNELKGLWNPRAVYQWFDFNRSEKDADQEIESDNYTGDIIENNTIALSVNLGHSGKFLDHAEKILVSVYTVGHTLEKAYEKSNKEGDMLAAYVIDLIGRCVLEKTSARIKQIVEQRAIKQGWGVSPFLSPGSVKGWELEDQNRLCSLLPLDVIDVSIRDDGILIPFKSISCLMGIGPEYSETKVGNTCQVCNNKEDCQMRD